MPPADHGPPLTPAQVATLRTWIDQGADWGTNAVPAAVAVSIEPTGGWTGVSGDNKKFRELEGVNEGWSGGAEHFSYSEQLAPDKKLTIEGHALVPQQRLKVTVALEKRIPVSSIRDSSNGDGIMTIPAVIIRSHPRRLRPFPWTGICILTSAVPGLISG